MLPVDLARAAAPNGVSRVVDVAFGANRPLTSAVLATNGTIVSYGSDAEPEPRLPFYPLMRRGITIRLVLVFVMPEAALRSAVDDLTGLLADRVLTHPIAARYPPGRDRRGAPAGRGRKRIGKLLLMP